MAAKKLKKGGEKRGGKSTVIEKALAKLEKDLTRKRALALHLAKNPKAVLRAYGLGGLFQGRGVKVGVDIGASPGPAPPHPIHVDFRHPHSDATHVDSKGGHLDAPLHLDIPASHTDSGGVHADSPAGHVDYYIP